jgi:hypothetical protein
MAESAFASKAGELVEIALTGCRRLGTSIVSEDALAELGAHSLVAFDEARPTHQAR